MLAAVVPVWSKFFTAAADYSFRGLAIPILESIGIGCLIVIARTRNPLVDGDPPTKVDVVNPPSDPVQVTTNRQAPPANPTP